MRRRETALHDGDVARCKGEVEVGHEAAHGRASPARQRRGVDARTRHHQESQLGPEPARERYGVHHPMQQRVANRGAADGDDAQEVIGAEAQPLADTQARGIRWRFEPGDVPREVVVRLGPFADPRQPRPERRIDDVLRIPHEDRAVAQPPVPGALLQHLGVVVGGQGGFGIPTARHRQPSDEVGQPREREALQLGVLVQEVVDIPRLIADHQVVVRLRDHVVEDHEVVHEDLVHAADRLEGVQIVVGGLVFDVGGFVREKGGCRVDGLAGIRQHSRDRMLRQPVDLKVGVQRSQLLGDRDIAPRVTQTDRG